MTETQYTLTEAHLAEARALGVEHAKNAASWCVDGNTSTDHVERIVKMFDDGDPALWDYLPVAPNLSGEYADSPTPQSIAADILGADWEEHGYNAPDFIAADVVEALAGAYEEGVSETFEMECERIYRAALPSYGTVTITETGVSISADNDDLSRWANRPGHRWPCSTLEDLDAITATFDRTGLIDMDCPGLFYDNETGCYFERMEGDEFTGQSFEIDGQEFNAWSSDVLRDTLPREHPAWEVCVGQFID